MRAALGSGYVGATRALETDPAKRRADARELKRYQRQCALDDAREAAGIGDVDVAALDLVGHGASPEDGAAILEAFRHAVDLDDLRARLRAAFGREPVGLADEPDECPGRAVSIGRIPPRDPAADVEAPPRLRLAEPDGPALLLLLIQEQADDEAGCEE